MSIKDILTEAAKSSPPVAAGISLLAGIPLSTWVMIATLVYTLLQVYFLLRDKWWRERGKPKD